MNSLTITDNWYLDFFTGLNCELWERAVTPEWTNQEVNFLLATLNVPPGASLLDIQCGYGRHCIELAKRGYSLTGFDISSEFLNTLKQQVKAEQLQIQVIQGNSLTTQFTTTFDGAYCLGNSFGYVDYEGMDAFVQNIATALRSKARLVINSGLVAESILTHFPETKRYVFGDLAMDIRNSYVVEDSYMATEITYTKGSRVETHYFKHYVYTLAEIKRLLARHGLQIIAVYSSTDRSIYQLGDQQMYLVAEKQ